jgi:hypothetical protein
MRLGTAGGFHGELLHAANDGVLISLSFDASSLAPINMFGMFPGPQRFTPRCTSLSNGDRSPNQVERARSMSATSIKSLAA